MLKDLKDFERLLKLCRKFNVTEVTIESVTVKLGEQQTQPVATEQEEIPTDELTEEELMFYHVQQGD